MSCHPRRRAQRGLGLIDALIAIVILAFGLLGMSRLQGRTVTAATDAQLRTTASLLADELLNTVLVDTANAACYTVPAAGACGSVAAAQRANEWAGRVLAGLPGTVTRAVTLDAATGRLSVSLGWTSRDNADPRLFTVVTDVR